MNEINLERAQREEARWRILRVLDIGRPRGLAETVIWRALNDIELPITAQGVRRDLQYLRDRGLVSISGEDAEMWIVALTREGVDLVEYTIACQPGIARPKKHMLRPCDSSKSTESKYGSKFEERLATFKIATGPGACAPEAAPDRVRQRLSARSETLITDASCAGLLNEDRRLSILLALESSPRYEASAPLVCEVIERYYGHSASLDTVRADLAWLAEQGLAHVEELKGVSLVRVTSHGLDVALGRAACAGVRRVSQ